MLNIIWTWVCANPEMVAGGAYAAAEIGTRLFKTKDSAGLLKRIGAGIDIVLDIVRIPNRLK